MNNSRKMITLAVLFMTVAAVWWLVQLERDIFEISSPAGTPAPAVVNSPEPDPETWEPDEFKEFFIEYRLQRDRVRAGEVEMLNQMISNPNITPEGKKNAEEQLLGIIRVMEQELLVENMLKAHGHKDAVFFFRDGMANVVVQAGELTDKEFLQISEMVSNVTGVKMEKVMVTKHAGR